MKHVAAMLLISSVSFATASFDVTAQSHYNYNVYYSYDNPVWDASFLVSPSIKAETKPHYFTFGTNLEANYEKFTTETIQDHFDYSAAGKMMVNENGPQNFTLTAKQQQFSDPSFNSTDGRVLHEKSDGLMEYVSKRENGNQLKISLHYDMENINFPEYVYNPTYLNHWDTDVVTEYDFKFLPETFWFLRASGGYREYTHSDLDPTSRAKYVTYGVPAAVTAIKSNTYYGLGEIGLNGRLTDKTSVDCATGLLLREYPYWDSFVAPVFYLHFVEQVTRRDQLIAGYNYDVEDAYSTNYFLNQEIYLGLARVMGDQILILAKFSYEYKNYSTPVARNDQRVTGGVTVKYSLKPGLKLTGEFKVDLVASDAYNAASGAPAPYPDAPATYKAGSVGLGIAADL